MLIASIGLSFSGLIIRNIEFASPSQINFYRNIAFTSVIALIIGWRYRTDPSAIRVMFTPSIFLAAVGLATTGIAIVQALTHTLVANTVFIMGTVPFITMIAAYLLLGEMVSRITAIAMTFSIAGLLIMLNDGIGSGSNFGNMMALIAALGFSLFAIVARAKRDQDMLPALLLAGLIIVLVSFVSAFEDLSISLHDLFLCVLWGAGISGFAHWIFILSARYIAAAQLTMFGLFETALAPFWVWMFIGEIPGLWVLIGGGAIIVSIGLKCIMELQTHAATN